MGLTHIDASVANPAKPRQAIHLRFLVDSGAFYSVVPARVLRKLGIKPRSTHSDRRGASPVIFGEKDDSILPGTVSLEALGLMLDPMKRELRPMPMLLVAERLR